MKNKATHGTNNYKGGRDVERDGEILCFGFKTKNSFEPNYFYTQK